MEPEFTLFGGILFIAGFLIAIFGSAFISAWFMSGLLLSVIGTIHSIAQDKVMVEGK